MENQGRRTETLQFEEPSHKPEPVRTLEEAFKSYLNELQGLAGFLTGKRLGANQIEFVNLIIDHLTEQGVMEPALLYESPFTDLSPQGPEGVFNPRQVDELVSLLGEIRQRAVT